MAPENESAAAADGPAAASAAGAEGAAAAAGAEGAGAETAGAEGGEGAGAGGGKKKKKKKKPEKKAEDAGDKVGGRGSNALVYSLNSARVLDLDDNIFSDERSLFVVFRGPIRNMWRARAHPQKRTRNSARLKGRQQETTM